MRPATLYILLPLLTFCSLPCLSAPSHPSPEEIIRRSVEANKRDYEASLHYNCKEKDITASGSKTYQVSMIDGSPYQRVIAINGKPLTHAQQAQESVKEQQVRKDRAAETAQQHRSRVAKFERDRARDHAMMSELTKAFNFTYVGLHKLHGFNVYVLKASPRPGYQPPNMDCQVLPGMEGELWIDAKTFQWVQVSAHVTRPVSIQGFLAQVEPGTRFELNKAPVGDGHIWLASHFAMNSHSKILFMVNHDTQEEDTFWDYEPAK